MSLVKQIPNALTISRLVLAIIFPFIDSHLWLPLIIIAALTEWLDGLLARLLKAESKFGVFLDPIADKTLLSSIVFTFLFLNIIDFWEIFLVALREFTILAGTLWIVYRKEWRRFKLMEPLYSGKVATFAQYIFFFSLIIFRENNIFIFTGTVLISAWSGIQYITIFLRQGKLFKESYKI